MLGFADQFAPLVEGGTKTHTIRACRISIPRVGEICHCFERPRQKTMRLLGRWPCVKVQDIFINSRVFCPEATYIDIRIDGVPLSFDEKNLLAFRDGFRTDGGRFSLGEMMRYYKGRLPFSGKLIHWDFARQIA